jgi:integrase/recombinase XerC
MATRELDQPISEALRSFLAHLAGERRLSDRTVEAYGRDLSGFFEFLAGHLGRTVRLGDLGGLETRDFRAFMAARRGGRDGISPRSLARNLSAIRTFYAYGQRRWGLENDSLALVESPKAARSKPKPVSERAARDLVAAASQGQRDDWIEARDTAVLLLLYGCGLRISEALALTGREQEMGDALRVTGKGDKMRIVPVLPAVREAISNYGRLAPFDLTPEGPLFRGVRGGALGARSVQKTMTELRSALGLPVTATPHALRHAFATHLLAHGGDLRAIQELLGHANLSTTQIYADVETSQLVATYDGTHPRARRSSSTQAALKTAAKRASVTHKTGKARYRVSARFTRRIEKTYPTHRDDQFRRTSLPLSPTSEPCRVEHFDIPEPPG